MIGDGRAYGLAIAVQHILRLLENKGVLTREDTTGMLDAALEELKTMPLSPTELADAAKTIGALYLPTRG